MSSIMNWLTMAFLCFLAAGNLDMYINDREKGKPHGPFSFINLWAGFICLIPALCYMLK